MPSVIPSTTPVLPALCPIAPKIRLWIGPDPCFLRIPVSPLNTNASAPTPTAANGTPIPRD